MALNFQHEFAYADAPVVPVRISIPQSSVTTEAMVDTGAYVSLFDAELGLALNLRRFGSLAGEYNAIGIGGSLHRIPCWRVFLSVLGPQSDLHLDESVSVGFVPGLAKTVGNLLGRDFLELVDLGLHHYPLPSRCLYLGLARP